MKRKLPICFFMLMTIGLSLQPSDNYQVVLRNIAARVNEEEGLPSLFVSDFGVFPTIPYSPDNVVPMSDFLQWEKDAKNIAPLFRASQRGDTKRAGSNSKEISIVGSPQCFEACFGVDGQLSFIVLGSAKDINVPNSSLRKALAYAGHCDHMNAGHEGSKRALALALALKFDAAHEIRAATIWYQRSIQNGSKVVAPYYQANFLYRQPERFSDEQAADFMTQVVDQTYKFLAETRGHLPSMCAFAESLKNKGKFVEAVQWYTKVLLEKRHIPVIPYMLECIDMLWPRHKDDMMPPEDSVLLYVKEVYELAAYRFGDEEAGNRLADLMKKYDEERDDEDCYALEKGVLAKQIQLWPDKDMSNTMLRLALLDEESYNMTLLKCKRKWNKIYDMFLPAAQAGNVAAMIKLYRLSLKGGDTDKAQFWSDKLECLRWDIFETAKIKDALLYLAYLGVFGEDLLEDACSELGIDSALFKEAAEEYSFKPSVDPDISGFPATENAATLEHKLEHKRKREEDEVFDFERVIKKTKRKESIYNSLV